MEYEFSSFSNKLRQAIGNPDEGSIDHGSKDIDHNIVSQDVSNRSFPIIQLPEYLMSTVLFTHRKYQTDRHTNKNDPHPYLLVVPLLPKLPLHYYSPLHWEYPPSGSLASHSTFQRHGVNNPVSLVVLSLVFRL